MTRRLSGPYVQRTVATAAASSNGTSPTLDKVAAATRPYDSAPFDAGVVALTVPFSDGTGARTFEGLFAVPFMTEAGIFPSRKLSPQMDEMLLLRASRRVELRSTSSPA